MESVQTKGDAILNDYVKNHKWKLEFQALYSSIKMHLVQRIILAVFYKKFPQTQKKPFNMQEVQ